MSPAPMSEETWCLLLLFPDSRKAVGKEDPAQSHPWSPSLGVTSSRLFSIPEMQHSAGRRCRTTRLSFVFTSSKVWQKAPCAGGAVFPSAKPLETPHVPCSQQADEESWGSRGGSEEAEPRSPSKRS